MIPLRKTEGKIEFEIIEHLKGKDIPEKFSLEKFAKTNDTENMKIDELILNIKGQKINLSEKVSKMNFFESLKYYLFLENPLKSSYKEFLIEYFENYIKNQCGTDYILRQRDIYNNIFRKIDMMSRKNDWDVYHAQII